MTKKVKKEIRDVFSGQFLCWHSTCQWKTPGGTTGILAKYKDRQGHPVCWDHYVKDAEKKRLNG